jgi:putative transcriptional regulator
MGFVLNNYIEEPLSALLPELGDWASDQRVSIGGPVLSTQIFFVHRLGHLVDEASEIAKGLYLGGRFESVVEAMESGDVDSKDIRFFLGYSGWSTGQLLDEIREKSWYLHFLPSKNRAEEIWQEMLSSKGPSFAQAAQSPRNPNLN